MELAVKIGNIEDMELAEKIGNIEDFEHEVCEFQNKREVIIPVQTEVNLEQIMALPIIESNLQFSNYCSNYTYYYQVFYDNVVSTIRVEFKIELENWKDIKKKVVKEYLDNQIIVRTREINIDKILNE